MLPPPKRICAEAVCGVRKKVVAKTTIPSVANHRLNMGSPFRHGVVGPRVSVLLSFYRNSDASTRPRLPHWQHELLIPGRQGLAVWGGNRTARRLCHAALASWQSGSVAATHNLPGIYAVQTGDFANLPRTGEAPTRVESGER